MSGYPFLFADDDGTHHLFFQGNDGGGRTWHLSRRRVEWRGHTPRVAAP